LLPKRRRHVATNRLAVHQGEHPISVAYDRSSSTNVALAMTIRCLTPDGHVIRTVPTRPGFDEDVKRTAIARECRY